MKKILSILFVMTFLFSGYVVAEEDKLSVEVCSETAKSDGLSEEQAKEYIDQCVKFIAEDEQREQNELKQGS